MKKIIVFLLAAVSMATAQAQLPLLNSARSAGQDMTLKAVESALFVSKSNYRLKSKTDGKFYGRDGKKDFGAGYGVAVKTEEGVVMLSSQIMAWNNESDFQAVNDKYDAVLSSLELIKLDGSDQLPAKRVTQYSDQYQVVDPQSKGGLDIISESGEFNGWCVWLTTQSKSDDLTAKDIKCQANTKSIVVNDTTKTFEAGNIPQGVRVLGGIYVFPQYEEGGIIRFCVLGLLDNTFGKWEIVLPFGNALAKKHGITAIETQETGRKINITLSEDSKENNEGKEKSKNKDKKKDKSKTK